MEDPQMNPQQTNKITELVLTVRNLERRVQELETQAKETTKEKAEWITPKQAAIASKGNLTEYSVRAKIDAAIENPSGTKLIAGVHFTRTRTNSERWKYKVYWPSFYQKWNEEAYSKNV